MTQEPNTLTYADYLSFYPEKLLLSWIRSGAARYEKRRTKPSKPSRVTLNRKLRKLTPDQVEALKKRVTTS